jgi:aminoglycoside phosphotransferase (APT) family kinase protein
MAKRDPQGLDTTRLGAYLAREHPGLAAGPLTAELISGGRSNLTYAVSDGAAEWVLRRPPLGHVLATAHDMGREHRVITALGPTDVPVPRTYLHCADTDVIGAPFYLMERVPGTVYRTEEQTATLGPDRARSVSYALIKTLGDLHAVDPDAVGLGDFGRPAGYMARQVARWRKQLEGSHNRELPDLDTLFSRLVDTVPVTQRHGVVHGDYRLDNTMVSDDDFRIAAVLDWEMATLGDPLADLGLLSVYWDAAGEAGTIVASGITPENGFPPVSELLDSYAERSGLDLTPLPWYVAFGYFKLAVILEGIHFRFLQGKTVGEGFDVVGEVVPKLAASGLAALKN